MSPADGRITALLVDLGGLACRFRPERRLQALARATGLDADAVESRIWRSGLDARMDRGEFDLASAHRAVCAALEVAWPLDELCRLWTLAFEPDLEVLALVGMARAGARTALLTDNGPLLRHGLERWLHEVSEQVDVCMFSCELGACKPAPECFARALARLGAHAARTLLVDDSARNVEGARAAGLYAERCGGALDLARTLAAHGLTTRQ